MLAVKCVGLVSAESSICPALMTSAIPAEFTWPESEIEIDASKKRAAEEYWNATYIFNMLSRCPTMSMPSGRARNGVASAIQIVACSYHDQRVFNAAPAYERLLILAHIPWIPGSPQEANHAQRIQRKTRPA